VEILRTRRQASSSRPKISTVTEAAYVLPAGQKFLKDAYGYLAVPR